MSASPPRLQLLGHQALKCSSISCHPPPPPWRRPLRSQTGSVSDQVNHNTQLRSEPQSWSQRGCCWVNWESWENWESQRLFWTGGFFFFPECNSLELFSSQQQMLLVWELNEFCASWKMIHFYFEYMFWMEGDTNEKEIINQNQTDFLRVGLKQLQVEQSWFELESLERVSSCSFLLSNPGFCFRVVVLQPLCVPVILSAG